jgi:hypothetical protein
MSASLIVQACGANVHMTETMIAAYEARGEQRYLDRAERLARRICVELAAGAGDLRDRSSVAALGTSTAGCHGTPASWRKTLISKEHSTKRRPND